LARLTKREVEGIAAPPEGYRLVWDDDLPGLGVRVTPAGARSYVVQYRSREGVSRRLTLGRHGVMTAEQARALARQTLARVAEGADPMAERRRERAAPAEAPPTLADVAAAWREAQAARVARGRLRPRTLAEYERQLSAEILPRLGTRPMADLGPADAQRLQDALGSRPVLANRTVSLLASVWTWASERAYCAGVNPCASVEHFAEKRRDRHLSREDLARLGAALRRLSAGGRRGSPPVPPRVALLVRLIALTGCRPGEVKRLAWADVDLERGTLRVREGKTGNRVVWLSAPARAALEAVRALPLPAAAAGADGSREAGASPWVFPSRRNGGAPVGEFRKPWAALLVEAKIEHAEPYILRHTFASESEASGNSLLVTAALLGHSAGRLGGMTATYVHHVPEDVRRASERVAGRIAAALDHAEPEKVVRLRRQKPRA
jgi:integrase